MAKSSDVKKQSVVLTYLEHAIESAIKEQAAFGEAAVKDIESAMMWRAEGALVAVFTERHARTVREHLKLGRDLAPIYANLIDRLLLLAQGLGGSAESRAIAGLAKNLKEWLP
jgi:hypothetical protein